MNGIDWVELFGYLGSLLVLVSFLMTSVFKLRVVNTVGSIIFAIYALIIHSYPTALMNICLVLINLRFLWKMRSSSKSYDLVSVSPDDAYLQFLLKRHMDDIEAIFPKALEMSREANTAYILSADGVPIGAVLGKREGDSIELNLDYTLPDYRDFSPGSFLFSELERDGVKTVIYNGPTENHLAYLGRMGFVQDGDRYVKQMGSAA